MARTYGAYATTVGSAPKLQQAWQSMRVMRRFTQPELLTVAPLVGESLLTKYVKALTAAGFLRIVQPRVNGRPGSHNVYQLVRDSGPKAPIKRRDGNGVYDRNTCLGYDAEGRVVADADMADAEATQTTEASDELA